MDPAAIILGFTGPIGSGCTYVAQGIERHLRYKYFKVSDIIRQHLQDDGIQDPTVEDLQTKGNSLRQQHGEDYLVTALIDRIMEDPQYEDVNEIIIDGIKNVGEVKYLRFFPHFYLFSIHADKDTRKQRSVGKIVASGDEFERIDKRDELEPEPYGQQVKEVDYLSDIILLNNDEIHDLSDTPKRQFIHAIQEKYISRIEDLRENRFSPDYRPRTDEMAMTSAYIFSKMSSCLKRKVGCVIVDSRGLQGSATGANGNKVLSMPIIVSTGYNEVPLGSEPCMFNYKMCYRDYLQQAHAKTFNNCPKCGTAFSVHTRCDNCGIDYDEFLKSCPACHRELKSEVICSNPDCGINIFREYLPGAKFSPGKLLDVCRALHAEENALLALVNSPGRSTENLVLYTTTQPCNLCANKIVASGIKQIVFAEPYFMKESADILESGGVSTTRFEGVKSSAFFKLYQ